MDGKFIIGMMSGTSADGIDAVLVQFESAAKLAVIETNFTPFSEELRNQINHLAHSKQITCCSDTDLHERLAYKYAEACESLISKANVNKKQISTVANHGQTVRHEPNAEPPYSLQLGNPQTLANLTSILTTANFRQADLAAGGQGAPLMPAFHATVFGDENTGKRYLLNIGGVANLTHLGDTVIGFDTGPGNTLLDQWIYQHRHLSYDENGEWAAGGAIIPELFDRLISDPYFSLPFPKSTGPDYFNLDWIGDTLDYQAQDVQATLMEVTVQSIVGELQQLGHMGGEIFVCGGGAHNSFMMKRLAQLLPKYSINKTDDLGIPADWVEAVGFAWLGYCRLKDIPSNLPSVTGATDSVVLGDVFFPCEQFSQ